MSIIPGGGLIPQSTAVPGRRHYWIEDKAVKLSEIVYAAV